MSDDGSPLDEGRAVVVDDAPRYPTPILDRPIWVNWILDGLDRKRPVAPWQTGHLYPVEWNGDLPDEERPETTADEALRYAEFTPDELGMSLPEDAKSERHRPGVLLPPEPTGDTLVLVDLDDVRRPDGSLHPKAADLLRRFDAPAEVSQSGGGVHAWALGRLPDSYERFIAYLDDEPWVGDDPPMVEIYDASRHVAMTGRHVAGTPTDRLAEQAMIDTLVDEYRDEEAEWRRMNLGGARPIADADEGGETTASGGGAAPVPSVPYRGPPADSDLWDGLDGHALGYRAAVEAHYRGYAEADASNGQPGINYWRITGAAAAHGQRLGKSVDEILSDLRGAPLDGESAGFGSKTPGRVEYDHRRAVDGRFNPPSLSTLAYWGVLPPALVPEEGGTPAPDPRGFVHETTPPRAVRDAEPVDVDDTRDDMAGDRIADHLGECAPSIWLDEAGTGKTTNGHIGLHEAGEATALLFDKHEKAHEHVLAGDDPGDLTPPVDLHLKGAEQPIHDECMDAKVAAANDPDPDATPECPTHGHPSNCPKMHPVYNLDADHPVRKAFERLVGGTDLKVRGATFKLKGEIEDVVKFDPTTAPWFQQFDELESARHVVGVAEYLPLKTLHKGRVVILDDAGKTPALDASTLTVDALARQSVSLRNYADHLRTGGASATHDDAGDEAAGFDEGSPYEPGDAPGGTVDDEATRDAANADEVAAFIDRLTTLLADDTVTLDGEDDGTGPLAAVDPPRIDPLTYKEWNQNYDSYRVHKLPEEAIARLRRGYAEWRLDRYDETGSIGSAPLRLDPVLAAAAEAGPDGTLPTSETVRKALAIPLTVETCPQCGQPTEKLRAGRACSDDCGWREGRYITRRDGPRARAVAALDGHADGADWLVYERLPDPDSLPSDPLIFDADGDPQLVADYFMVDPDRVRVHGDETPALPGANVTQILNGAYHAGTLKQSASAREKMQQSIDDAAAQYDRPLYVVEKGVKPLFDWPDDAVRDGRVKHYYGLRGLNFDDCDAVLLFGAPHANVPALRRQARLLGLDRPDDVPGGVEYSTHPDCGNPPAQHKLVYDAANDPASDATLAAPLDERGRAVEAKAFTGRVGALWRDTHEGEIAQAVHRIRPILATPDDPKDVFLFTNVPTRLPVDTVATLDELSAPLRAHLPLPDGALALVDALADVTDGNAPDGFRDGADCQPARLVTTDDDGDPSFNVSSIHRLARLAGVTTREGTAPSRATVGDWLGRLERLGVVEPGEYEQRCGVRYGADLATLKSALQVTHCSSRFKVAAVRRFSRLVEAADGGTAWLRWARAELGLRGNPEAAVDGPPPPT